MSTETAVPEAHEPPAAFVWTEAGFTNACAYAAGPKADRRLSSIIASLTLHLHAFCRENDITAEEFEMAVKFVSPPIFLPICPCEVADLLSSS